MPRLALLRAPQAEDVRASALAEWAAALSLPAGFDPVKLVAGESAQLEWVRSGLPRDDLCRQNAAAVLASCRPPLLVDPSSQARAGSNVFREP